MVVLTTVPTLRVVRLRSGSFAFVTNDDIWLVIVPYRSGSFGFVRVRSGLFAFVTDESFCTLPR